MSTTDLFVCVPSKKNLDHSNENEVFAAFTFNPPKLDTSKRPVLDIAVALDVSGSMGGPKIEAAKQSLLKLIDHLTERDHLAIVTFDSNVEVVLPVTLMTDTARIDARKRVTALHSGSSTNLSGGLLQALTLLRDHDVSKDAVRRAMLFTDGQANQGIRDPQEMIAAVTKHRAGIGISTFGYGADHNPELLASLAMDGGFYFVTSPDAILTAFGTELGGLLATFAQNVELRVDPAEGVEIAEVLNDATVTQDGKAAVIRCDDLLAEQPYTVVLAMKVTKRDNAFPREVALLHARAKFFDVANKRPGEETAALKVTFVKAGAEDKEHAKAVLDLVVYQRSVRAQAAALAAAQAGNLAGARLVLHEFAAFAGSVGTESSSALGDLALDLKKEAYADQDQYKSRGHSLGTSTRRAMARGRDFGDVKVGGRSLSAVYGSRAQNDAAKAFVGKDPAATLADKVVKPVEPVEPPTPSSGISKSRSGRW